MSDLLRKWMLHDIGVNVPINNFEKDFANGYAFGELLYRCNLQPDFEQFVDSSSPDAVLKNFTRLQPTLARLGVPLDSRTVDSIQKGQKGVVGRVIYAIKVAVDGLEKELLCAPSTLSSTLKGGSTLRASHTLLEARNWKQEKMLYDSKMVSIFEESLRRRSMNPNSVMESLHLRKFTEEAIRQENFDNYGKRKDREEKDRKRDIRRQNQRTFQKERRENLKRLESENIRTWIKNRSRMRSLEAADLEREMQYVHKLEATIKSKNEEADLETRKSIEQFERTIAKTTGSKFENPMSALDGNDQAELLETLERGSMPSLEHMQYLRTKVPSANEMAANARAYMSRMRAKKVEESIARKERERRRRHTILEHQKKEEQLDNERKANTILETISRRSELESNTQTNLEMLLQEHKIMKENKAFRESQYTARSQADEREALVREGALAEAILDDYKKTTTFEQKKWLETQEENRKQVAFEIRSFAHETAWQLLGLAERCIEYRELSEAASASSILVPRKEWREWKTLFIMGTKLIEATQLTEFIEESDTNNALDDATLKDYMAMTGEWQMDTFEKGIGTNIPFGNTMLEISHMADTRVEPSHIPIGHLKCRVAMMGKPFSGQSVIAQRIAEKYNLVYINPDKVVKEAVDLYLSTKDIKEGTETQQGDECEENQDKDGESMKVSEGNHEISLAKSLEIQHIALGGRAQESLLNGDEIDDKTLVDLVVNEIERLCPPPDAFIFRSDSANESTTKEFSEERDSSSLPSGFVLDSFPRTAEHAKLLERRLTGLDLDEAAARQQRLSTLAPPQPDKLEPLKVTDLISGLDSSFWFKCTDETALKRAKGFVLDPLKNRLYHLDFDPPPANEPGLHERLVSSFNNQTKVLGNRDKKADDFADDDNPNLAAMMVEVQANLASSHACHDELVAWLSRFDKLQYVVEADETMESIAGRVEQQIQEIIASKDVAVGVEAASKGAQKACAAAVEAAQHADEARSAARQAAKALFNTKKAQVEANALVSPSSKGKGNSDSSTGGEGGLDAGAISLINETASAEIAELLKKAAESLEIAETAAKTAETEAKQAEHIARLVAEELANTDVSADAMAQAEAAVKAAVDAQERSNEAAKNAKDAAQEAVAVWKDASEKGLSSDLVPEGLAAIAASGDVPEQNVAAQNVEVENGSLNSLASGVKLLVREKAAKIYESWQSVETNYFSNLCKSFHSIREERSSNLAHFVQLKKSFQALLKRPDKQQHILDTFQNNFNSIDLDMRRLEDAKAELVLRSDELRDELWDICDDRLRHAESELSTIVADSYISDHIAQTALCFAAIAQSEINRCLATLQIIKSCYAVKADIERYSKEADDCSNEGNEVSQGEEDDATKEPIHIDIVAVTGDTSITADFFSNTDTMPSWAVQLVNYSPSLCKALLDCISEVKEDSDEHSANNDAVATSNPDDLSLLRLTNVREKEILEKRIMLIAFRAIEVMNDLVGLGERTHNRLKEWMTSRFKGECSAVGALHDVVKSAIASESELPFHLRLEGETMILDETELVLDPVPPPPEVPDDEPKLSRGYLNCGQLSALATTFKKEFPQGLVSTANAAYIIQRTGSISCGTSLPSEWLTLEVGKLQKILSTYEIASSGLIDWREMIVGMVMASYPQVMAPTPVSIQEIGSFLSEVDLDRDGIVNAEEFLSVKFWFSNYKNMYGLSTPQTKGFDLHQSLTRLLFKTFSTSGLNSKSMDEECVDFKAVLLYLCMDYRQQFALLKTLAVEQMGHTWQPIGARQLYNICYPLGVPTEFKNLQIEEHSQESIEDILYVLNKRTEKQHYDTIEKHNEGIIDKLIESEYWPKLQPGSLARYKLKDIAISLSC